MTFAPSFLDRRPLTRAAFELASAAHAGQRRASDSAPLVVHPLETAAVLHSFGADDEVTAAAMLHETLEDTDLRVEQIAARFGDRVAELVRSLTDDAAIPDERERDAALRSQVAAAGEESAAIFAADKLSKAYELRTRLSSDPARAADRETAIKLEHYRASVEMLARRLGDHPLVEQLRFEVEALDARGTPQLARSGRAHAPGRRRRGV